MARPMPGRPRGRLIAVEGGSAAGKTTVVQAAARRFGWVPLAEAYDRLDPAPSLEFATPAELLRLEATLLAEEVRRYRAARSACVRGRTVLADTGFLGPLTYTRALARLGRAPVSVSRALERSARALVRDGSMGIPDLTVYLRTTTRERSLRAARDADRHPLRLRSRHEAVGRVERRYFEDLFPRVRPPRFLSLRAGSDPEVLGTRLAALVETGPTEPATRADALAILTALTRERTVRAGPRAGPNR